MTTVLTPTVPSTKTTDANNGRKKLSSEILSPVLPVAGQKDAHFKSACLLAHLIDLTLESGRVHYRTKAGQLLTTLDEVINAILNLGLLEPEG
jgi:hypothetical protein